MTHTVDLAVECSDDPPPAFWENDLEMGLEDFFVRSRRDGFIDDWVNRCTGRQVNVLCINLDLDGTGSVQCKKDRLRSNNDKLQPYLLVDQFAKYKSKIATVDFAKRVLADGVFETCRKSGEDFDTKALLFAIYKNSWSDLRLVFHLDKIHKSGFARMRLKDTVRRPQHGFQEFLHPETVQEIFEGFDKAKGDGRTSEFKSVVNDNGHHLVFIRRAEHPDLVLREGGIVHGYRPEWIILDFADNAKRVDISSVSVSVPLEIANRLVSGYFGRSCEYENECQITFAKQLELFLDILRKEKTGELLLVEVVVLNSPLEGSPKIKITDPDSHPIGDAIGHFEKAVGGILSEIENIESIKVYYHKKRVSLIFEKVEDSDDEYVVRYSDHRLNATERRAFEGYLRDIHGIPILSTEKRFKR